MTVLSLDDLTGFPVVTFRLYAGRPGCGDSRHSGPTPVQKQVRYCGGRSLISPRGSDSEPDPKSDFSMTIITAIIILRFVRAL